MMILMMVIIIGTIITIMIMMIEIILIVVVVIINSPFQPGSFSIGFITATGHSFWNFFTGIISTFVVKILEIRKKIYDQIYNESCQDFFDY